MADILTPTLGESVTEATIARWAKKPGDTVKKDEPLVELETEKVSLEVSAPVDGVLQDVAAGEGDTVIPGQVLGRVAEGAAGAVKASPAKTTPAAAAAPAGEAQPEPDPSKPPPTSGPVPDTSAPAASPALPLSPSVQRIVSEAGLDPAAIPGSGKDGRITKGDALAALEARAAQPAPSVPPPVLEARPIHEREERVRMTRLRQTIARRLKEAQSTAAMLTTFNEVDMSAVMALRNQYKDAFEKRHGVKLGFMGFFVKACIAALQEVPAVNAEIDGTDIVYKNHYDIGVAVGTEKGLVVPVLRDADQLSLAGVEKAIGAMGKKARDGSLSLEDLQGGTFTISNGGVYGSLMSTPILNAPQSGILGMHKIQERPVAVGGQVVIRPMMYLAVSYDHRIVDGKEAVTFLVRIKDVIEDPERLLLEV
jgi:2-oxoglutarate dehydrogenase E2 component (dihydrolipoamide succinyltransferase)